MDGWMDRYYGVLEGSFVFQTMTGHGGLNNLRLNHDKSQIIIMGSI